ncbi:hypothetical protein L484_014746 [Morus notabilis]|uniref:Uncharacterized protein n=1 Tax=Morus notabilis TaxID=981085 RepID=W9QPI3_9ROSA|nr:hypothetical protein L484_014746 [Morus notabilis]
MRELEGMVMHNMPSVIEDLAKSRVELVQHMMEKLKASTSEAPIANIHEFHLEEPTPHKESYQVMTDMLWHDDDSYSDCVEFSKELEPLVETQPTPREEYLESFDEDFLSKEENQGLVIEDKSQEVFDFQPIVPLSNVQAHIYEDSM